MAVERRDGRIPQTTENNFGPFSEYKPYREENRAQLAIVHNALPNPFFQVDIAAGTGLVSQETANLCNISGKTGTIIGVDPDHYAISKARADTPDTQYCRFIFLEGTVDEVTDKLMGIIPPEGVDVVSMHDAIHEIEGDENKRRIFEFGFRILKPGGKMSINTAFHKRAMGSQTLKYGKWTLGAYRLAGERPVNSPLAVLSPEDYKKMIIDAGFEIWYSKEEEVYLSREALESIAKYPTFTKGVFPHATPETIPIYSKHLAESLIKRDIAGLNRTWYRLVGEKPFASSVASLAAVA
ncbi:class I SAM-dependent methyltransferase [Candidatus Roizmanbacteria bacterium]|nr:class I SAM-dependent methyltransferase [Candidatus Roizmanbacteria bacterium]